MLFLDSTLNASHPKTIEKVRIHQKKNEKDSTCDALEQRKRYFAQTPNKTDPFPRKKQ